MEQDICEHPSRLSNLTQKMRNTYIRKDLVRIPMYLNIF